MPRRCGATPATQQLCNAANFNGPFVSGLVFGSATYIRVLTAVTKGAVRYTASASVDADSTFNLSVSPSTFQVSGPGAQVTASITVRRGPGTKMGSWQFGQVRQGDSVPHSTMGIL